MLTFFISSEAFSAFWSSIVRESMSNVRSPSDFSEIFCTFCDIEPCMSTMLPLESVIKESCCVGTDCALHLLEGDEFSWSID